MIGPLLEELSHKIISCFMQTTSVLGRGSVNTRCNQSSGRCDIEEDEVQFWPACIALNRKRAVYCNGNDHESTNI